MPRLERDLRDADERTIELAALQRIYERLQRTMSAGEGCGCGGDPVTHPGCPIHGYVIVKESDGRRD